MKILLLLIALNFNYLSYGQVDDRITTIDFVQILNDNKDETIYYYQNNWKVLRDMAIEKEYIASYQLLETQSTEDAPFQIMLITTFAHQKQYDLREDHFGELIEDKGPLKLMNDKKPADFRKILFNKNMVRHLN